VPSKSARNKNKENGEGKVSKPGHAAQLQAFEKHVQRSVDVAPVKNIRVGDQNAVNNA